MRSLYWVRNDLRMHDNETLLSFLSSSSEGCMIWFENASFRRAGPHRRGHILSALAEHQKNLKTSGLEFAASTQTVQETLQILFERYKFDEIYFCRQAGHEELQDQLYAEILAARYGVKVKKFEDNYLIAPKNLTFEISKMPLVFTDFRKLVENDLQVEAVKSVNEKNLQNFKCLPIEIPPHQLQSIKPSANGEKAALQRVHDYLWQSRSVLNYKNTRNGLLNFDDSTKLSPFLSTGSLSAAYVYHEIKKFEAEVEANESTYWVIFELLWRDYFKYLSLKIQNKLYKLSGIRHLQHDLDYSREKFKDWAEGRTKSDFINANMNELRQTGWMSNRGRQNAASYLIHDLHLPWVWGAEYFESQLIDYDVTSNWGNWLYLSGQGTDPRSRKFNTEKQAQDYDPAGEYRKKWLA